MGSELETRRTPLGIWVPRASEPEIDDPGRGAGHSCRLRKEGARDDHQPGTMGPGQRARLR